MVNFFKETRDNTDYLFVEIQESLTPIWHQVEMISSNLEIGLPEPFYTEKNDKCYFMYQVNNWISLDKYASSNQVNPTDLCEGVARLCYKIIDSDRYLLFRNSFLFNVGCVFVTDDIKNIQLIYFPCKETESVNNSLKALICELVTSSIQFTPGQEIAVATLLQYIKSSDFCVEGLLSVCDAILRKKGSYDEFDRILDVDQPLINTSQKIINQQSTSKAEPLHADSTKLSYKFLKVQFIILFIGVCMFIFPIHKVTSFSGVDARAGALCILALIDLIYLIYSRRQKPNTTNIRVSRDEDKTVLLQHLAVCFGYLLDRQTKIQHELNKKELLIGRSKEEVDVFCENAAVGKHHAKLEFKEGGYSVKDLDSKNGTYINGNRLETGNEKRIKHGDVLSFANSEFIVFTSKPS